jgi:hypothetical protein
MSQASAGGGKRAEMERTLVQRSIEDESFRQRLLDNPKATVEQELGSRLPEGFEVRAVEESADTIYLVLPSASAVGEGGEISDQQLEGWPAGGGVHLTRRASRGADPIARLVGLGPEVEMFRPSFSLLLRGCELPRTPLRRSSQNSSSTHFVDRTLRASVTWTPSRVPSRRAKMSPITPRHPLP